jgi:hypothetical protein
MVWERSALGEDLLLAIQRQLDVAMAVAMDMHEHGTPDEKSVFMNPGVWPLRHAGQRENPLPEFLMQFFI